MNCRPGDMAMVIRSIYPHLLGRIITVHNLLTTRDGSPCWSYTGNLDTPYGPPHYAEDCCLRPIRDPGDDAVDEMVQLVGEATARTA